jgi:hypothetical protein
MAITQSIKHKYRRHWCYAFIFLVVSIHRGDCQERNVVRPLLGVAPLAILGEYGVYQGLSLFGGIEIAGHHVVELGADLAPWGSLGIEDVATDDKEQHWGGVLGYRYSVALANKLLRLEPGMVVGRSSIPYLYGTLHPFYMDSAEAHTNRPERERIWGAGPELRILVGRKKVQFFVLSRVLFAKDMNDAVFANMGISVKL